MRSINHSNESIFCGDELVPTLINLVTKKAPSLIVVLTDEHTKAHCYPAIAPHLRQWKTHLICIPSGESSKSITQSEALWVELSQLGAARDSLIINLGGGVITDLGGFVAATYQRGIDFLNIPTTLLGMVDAAIGGKCGVDLGPIKNQIGVITSALGIIIYPPFLNTLPQRELISGWIEMIKHGFITEQDYLKATLLFETSDLNKIESLIWASVMIKNKIVQSDSSEKGARKTLNFGHTLGHAIESYGLHTHGQNWIKHGEAIALGMALACYLSHKLYAFPEQVLNNYLWVVRKHVTFPKFDKKEITTIIDYLKYDKKNSHGAVNFVLLKAIGQEVLDAKVNSILIYEAFDFINQE